MPLRAEPFDLLELPRFEPVAEVAHRSRGIVHPRRHVLRVLRAPVLELRLVRALDRDDELHAFVAGKSRQRVPIADRAASSALASSMVCAVSMSRFS